MLCVLSPAGTRSPLCSTRREYVPVGLTPASLLATVAQTVARMQAYLYSNIENMARRFYG